MVTGAVPTASVGRWWSREGAVGSRAMLATAGPAATVTGGREPRQG